MRLLEPVLLIAVLLLYGVLSLSLLTEILPT